MMDLVILATAILGGIVLVILARAMASWGKYRLTSVRKEQGRVRGHDTEVSVGRRLEHAIRQACPRSGFWIQSHWLVPSGYWMAVGKIGASLLPILTVTIDMKSSEDRQIVINIPAGGRDEYAYYSLKEEQKAVEDLTTRLKSISPEVI
jgi:hypothetical protein